MEHTGFTALTRHRARPWSGYMGRPFIAELQELEACYAEGMRVQPYDESILDDIGFNSNAPLVIIGSGGALSAAKFIASLREFYTGKPVRVATPMEIIQNPLLCNRSSVLLVSAGGNNRDIVSAFECAKQARPDRMTIFCTKKNGKIVKLASHDSKIKSFVFNTGGKGDGFLALNSILTFAMQIGRPSALQYGGVLPIKYSTIYSEVRESLGSATGLNAIWDRKYAVILYGLSTAASAFDFESKATEAGLISSLPSDFRNFGHGRHHWIAKNMADTGIIAMSSTCESKLAEATLKAIPKEVPRIHLGFPGDYLSVSIKSLISVFHLIGSLGIRRGIDPGRPGVPQFGSKIYSLGPKGLLVKGPDKSPLNAAIRRKMDAASLPAAKRSLVERFAKETLVRLESTEFCGAAVDFDGTLVETGLRQEPISPEVSASLNRLIKIGGILVVCTGRGKSAHAALRRSIKRSNWGRVAVSFYNGASICPLLSEASQSLPLIEESKLLSAQKSIERFLGELLDSPILSSAFTHDLRSTQLTLRPRTEAQSEPLLHEIQRLTETEPYRQLKCIKSSHSIDVIPVYVSKVNALEFSKKMFKCKKNSEFLRIGDMGEWPGNDSELLDHYTGLSVDRVSSSLQASWNFSDETAISTDIFVKYLNSFSSNGQFLSWKIDLA